MKHSPRLVTTTGNNKVSATQDLTKTGCAELVMGPVVFDNFCLEDRGKFYMLRKAPRHHIAYQAEEQPAEQHSPNKH